MQIGITASMGIAALNASISGSKLVWGVAALLANVGSRFIIGELTPAQQGVLKSPIVKRIVLFCMLFIPTRDVLLSVCLTVVASALLEFLLNEESKYCVLPDCLRRGEGGRPSMHQMPVGLRTPMMGPIATAVNRSIVSGGRVHERECERERDREDVVEDIVRQYTGS